MVDLELRGRCLEGSRWFEVYARLPGGSFHLLVRISAPVSLHLGRYTAISELHFERLSLAVCGRALPPAGARVSSRSRPACTERLKNGTLFCLRLVTTRPGE